MTPLCFQGHRGSIADTNMVLVKTRNSSLPHCGIQERTLTYLELLMVVSDAPNPNRGLYVAGNLDGLGSSGCWEMSTFASSRRS